MRHAPTDRRHRLATSLRLALVAGVVALLAPTLVPSGSRAAVDHRLVTTAAKVAVSSGNPVTPGDFTGYAFDQCVTPTQTAMNAWLGSSPFLAVGIYISGDSRACRNQPNLTPAWVRTQLANGWRLLPITMGPQASCQPRFPRYKDDFKISSNPGAGKYSQARTMGQNSATSTVADAQALGIVPGSTLWYDMEGYNSSDTACRDSALAFLSAWTTKIHALGYVSGVYSSAGSGIADLDNARVEQPGTYTLPDRIWLARWDGVANTSTSYIRSDGWLPGGRVKQYQGGHDETWGGVKINIDRSYLSLGKGSVAAPETHCDGVTVSFRDYAPLHPPGQGTPSAPAQVKALQCLLRERGAYSGKIDGVYNAAVSKAAGVWQAQLGFPVDAHHRWFRRDWMSLLSGGDRPAEKTGSAGAYVRRAQRALNAADLGFDLANTGVFDAATTAAVRTYQKKTDLPVTGVVNASTWLKLQTGKR